MGRFGSKPLFWSLRVISNHRVMGASGRIQFRRLAVNSANSRWQTACIAPYDEGFPPRYFVLRLASGAVGSRLHAIEFVRFG